MHLKFFSVPLCRKESETNLKGILGYVDEDLVSTDFVGDSRCEASFLVSIIILMIFWIDTVFMYVITLDNAIGIYVVFVLTGQAFLMPRLELL